MADAVTLSKPANICACSTNGGTGSTDSLRGLPNIRLPNGLPVDELASGGGGGDSVGEVTGGVGTGVGVSVDGRD